MSRPLRLYDTFCVATICLLTFPSIGQPAWIRNIDLASYDQPSGLLRCDQEYNYLIHRGTEGNGNPIFQYVSKYSNEGKLVWQMRFSSLPSHVFEGPYGALSNGDLLAGFVFQVGPDRQYRFHRISPEGQVQWITELPTLYQFEIVYRIWYYKILERSPNDIYVYFRMNNYNPSDPTVIKDGYMRLDSLGRETERVYFDTHGEYQRPLNIIPVGASHYLRVVSPRPPSFWVELRFELLDTLYNRIWSYEIGPEDSAGGGPVCADAAGNIYFTWKQDPSGQGDFYYRLPAIGSISSVGKFRWMRYFAERDNTPVFYDIMATSDGRIIASGQEGNEDLNGGRHRTGLVVCIDTAGTKLWERRYVLEESSISGNNFRYMTEAGDGGIVLAGESLIPGDSDAYIMKVDTEGCLLPDCELYNFISIYTRTEDAAAPEQLFKHSVADNRLLIRPDGTMPPGRWCYAVYAVTGQPLSTGLLAEDFTQVDITGYRPGMYVLRVWEAAGGGSGTVKFVKSW